MKVCDTGQIYSLSALTDFVISKCDEQKPSCTGCLRNGLKCSLSFLIPTIYPKPRNTRSLQSLAVFPFCIFPNVDLQPVSLELQTTEVFHHYYYCTAYTGLCLAPADSLHIWQESIPNIALSYPFLMHGLLAISALHLAYLNPARRSELVTFASCSEQIALPLFRKMIPKVDQSNVHAIFAFSGFVVPYIIATSNGECGIPSLDNATPHWFLAIRGFLSLLSNNLTELARGPFAPVLVRTALPIAYGDNPEDAQLLKLNELLESKDSASKKHETDIKSCREALDELRREWALTCSPCRTLSAQNVVYIWPGAVSQQYLRQLYDRRPEALIVLAHYCVLLKRVDSTWYWKGIGVGLIDAINDGLSPVWRPWIRWAIDQPLS